MHVGIVGCGRVGSVHARTCLDHSAVDRVDVVDPVGVPEGLRSAPLRWRPVLDGRETGEWDAAIVATPTGDHASAVAHLLDQGVPTLCEKPISLDPDVTADLGRRATAAGVPLRSGLQRRFDPASRAVRGLLVSGSLGDPLWVSSSTRDTAPPPPSYLLGSGGIFLDMHVHDIDVVMWLLESSIDEVTATGAGVDQPELAGVADHGTTTVALQTQRGVLATVTGSRWSAPGYAVELTALGRAAEVRMDPAGEVVLRSPLRATTVHPGSASIPHGFTERFAIAYRVEVGAFLDEVGGAEPSCADWSEDRAAVVVALAAARSATDGRRIAVPAASGSTPARRA